MSLHAQVTVTADVNMLALQRILLENGIWLVWVHNKRIEQAVKVPPGRSVDQLIEGSEAGLDRDQSHSTT